MPTVAIIRTRRPDVSARALARVNREASDEALRMLQRQFIPYHFKRTAVNRYPVEYGKTVYFRRKNWYTEDGTAIQLPKRVPYRILLAAVRTKRPLVKSGLTESIAVFGEHSFTGRSDRRRMIMRGLPRYFYARRNLMPGRFDKVAALETVNAQESEELIRFIDSAVTQKLRQTI